MGVGIAVLLALAGGLLFAVVIYIAYLTLKKLKQLLRERLDRRKKTKVAFGKTRKIVDECARKILEKAPSMTMEELEKVCEETPYFVVDYDPDTGAVSDYTTIQTEGADEKIDDLMCENGEIILFE